MEIQIIVRKVCWQCPAMFCLYSLHLKQTFPPIIWIFTEGEGDGIESRLPFKIFFALQFFNKIILIFSGSKAGVKLHMQRIHRKDDYKFDCDMCDFKTYMKTKLDDHVKLREKQSANMFFCEKCDFKSCTSYGLVFHRSKIHQITKLMKRYAFKKHFNQNYKNE